MRPESKLQEMKPRSEPDDQKTNQSTGKKVDEVKAESVPTTHQPPSTDINVVLRMRFVLN